MKTLAFVVLLISLMGCTSPEKELSNTFYCFSNAGNLPGAPEGLDANVNFFKDLGFAGWGGHYGEEDYPARRAALDRAGMQMPEIYWNLEVDSAGTWSSKEGIREAIMDSKDRNLIVSLIVRAPAYQENQRAGDPLVAEAVRELADFAAPYGVKVAVYPHVDVYCETAEHSVRLAKMAGRDNVGAIFNLCHFLKKEGENSWEQELSKALPYLYMISISGADAGNTREMGWDRLIQPLGEGSFDTYPLVKLARDMGYEGPFGLQTYNIKQDAKVALNKSIATWQEYQQRYRKEAAGTSARSAGDKEVPSEFTALFDGESSRGWRGVNSDSFPEEGWQIKDGLVMVHASEGAESAGGGDIVTNEKYGDFELRWEWKLLTKGGNSGVKYYVEERKLDNMKQGIGLEYQILDDANHAWMLEGKMSPCDYHTLGSLYEIYPASCDKAPAPLGEWNSSRIVSRDGQVEHWLNGKLILSFNRFSEDFRQKVRESKFRPYSDFGQIQEGHLLIQDHGSEVHYRNMKVKRYSPLFPDKASYVKSVEQWQKDRLEGLKSKDGWLNLAGIYWLKEGTQTFGSDPGNDIVFPSKAPPFIGSLTLKGEGVHLQVKDGIEVYMEGKAVKEVDLSYPSSGKPSYLHHGDFAWYIMKRHKSLAVRLRDYKNPAIEALDHLPSYPINTAYVVEARLKPFDEPRIITVNTPFQDYTQDYSCPGVLHFMLNGEKLTLLPFESGESYFLIFSDETSALETYGGGRFMYTKPDSTGRILLDFNKAYNPPCAVTPFAACPMPPRENHLPVKVEAGEKVVAKH